MEERGSGRAPTDVRPSSGLVEALTRLDELAKHLRRECPWDREQDERSIVPHTVEEAYELADAAHSGDDGKLLDELGDVLYQVYFLSLLLEERGAGDLATVADNTRTKLIRRHPHVFGETRARDAAEAIESWGAAKRELERGGAVFGELPETLPAPLYAQKVQKRMAAAGLGERHPGEALSEARRTLESFFSPGWTSHEESFERMGTLLWDVVDAARALGVDPELALREVAKEVRSEAEETKT